MNETHTGGCRHMHETHTHKNIGHLANEMRVMPTRVAHCRLLPLETQSAATRRQTVVLVAYPSQISLQSVTTWSKVNFRSAIMPILESLHAESCNSTLLRPPMSTHITCHVTTRTHKHKHTHVLLQVPHCLMLQLFPRARPRPLLSYMSHCAMRLSQQRLLA